MFNIVIAGDLFPFQDNISLFEDGNSEMLFGTKISDLFTNADFSVVNLEGSLTDSNVRQRKIGPSIKASSESLKGLAALGVRSVTLANNHVTDYLEKGVADTISYLDKYGIKHFGASSHPDSINKFLSLDYQGVKVCIYGVSETFFNEPYVNVYDEYIVCEEIRHLSREHDFLIVLYHGGTENFPYPTPRLRKRFHRMADCGADFITAQHTHCIGCSEQYGKSYLLYGQGNFLFTKSAKASNRRGLVTELNFDNGSMKVNQHLVSVQPNGTLRYETLQDLSDFEKRGKEVLDDAAVVEIYKHFIADNHRLLVNYTSAYRGKTSFWKLRSKFFPKHNFEIRNRYTEEQILRILLSLQSDRTGENVLYMWRNIWERYQEG